MPSPIAHVAAAVAAGVAAPSGSPLRARRALLAAAIASVLPDADLLLSATLPGGIAWHHGPTHSLLGAALLGCLVALAAGLRGTAGLWVVVSAVLHPLFDWQLGVPGDPPSFGVPLFWPMRETRYVAAHPIFRPFGIHEPGFLANMFTRAAVEPYVREVAFAAVVLGYAFVAGRRSARRRGRRGQADRN